MNGKQLYEFYALLQLRENCMVDDWYVIEPNDRQVWEAMADLLCPELSDEAKEILKCA
jgi:hypothetical protein